ncbi:MAG: hypothetical protein COV96_02015 [Candidatus Zambryskibacteria bacterium CG11_big_fil_rev_8_21_14_0_20_42_18]|uniref:Uncharacterized protein n=1 Tax=Candidatus Zambryskibacteria bacterium CG_4_9_14_3_um_filter_42_15 TaxID=1975112 RepID=A0A2M7WT81_9BACT|nr:MAG: hypothetical protein COV96_02015 [Candidatus Zambryskibacteria bacterium CG11_big_fil_rev_8_21_14_0_20_42_18]PJA33194.1 MAG: hypothetical protein CO185_00225 [Candidatus Zambryskibacteria bacterium CG_4_9_14_3_um_filter_42_15]
MKIYIASSEKYVGKIHEDIYMRDACRNMRLFSEIATLSDITNISESSDVVILKSIWGYHLHYKEFIKEVSRLKKKGVILVNDYNFIFWNIDKYKYLNEINHMNVIPTASLQLNGLDTTSEINSVISETCRRFNADTLIIKPSISESGYLTFKYNKNNNNEMVVAALFNNRQLNFIAQPYRSSVSEGEISVIIINGVLLYGIKRFPGIFTDKLDPVYLNLSNVPRTIQNETVALRNFFLKRFRTLPNICRVDFVRVDTGYEILEVELIDPDLFFRYIPEHMKETTVSALYQSFTNR